MLEIKYYILSQVQFIFMIQLISPKPWPWMTFNKATVFFYFERKDVRIYEWPFQFCRMDRLPVLDYSFRWAEIVTGLKFEKTICWLCSPDCINLCQNLISCLEHFPFKSFRQELSNINLQVYLRRAHNAYFRTRYVARPFFGNTNPNFIW